MIPDELTPEGMKITIPDNDEYKPFLTFLEKEYGIKKKEKRGNLLEIELERNV